MKSTERFIIVVSAIITFLLASVGITAIYWAMGGSFHVSWALGVYLIVELYLALLVLNVARRRPEQIAKETL